MVTLIVGNRGSGKTKKLIDFANEAVKSSKGNVVVVEKGQKLTYNLSYQARLIDVDEYTIEGFIPLYGFLSGICAGNYDVTDIFIDSTFKICGNDIEALSKFIEKVVLLSEKTNTNMSFLLSADSKDIPTNLNVKYINL